MLYLSLGTTGEVPRECLLPRYSNTVSINKFACGIHEARIGQGIQQGRPFSCVSKCVHNNLKPNSALNYRWQIKIAPHIPARGLDGTLKQGSGIWMCIGHQLPT